MVDLFRFRHWDLVSKRWIYFVLSGLLLLAGIIALVKPGLNLGVDFKGGGLVSYRASGHLPDAVVTEVRNTLQKAGIESEVKLSPAAMQSKGDSLIILSKVNTQEKLDKQVAETIQPAVKDALAKHQLEIVPGIAGKADSPESSDMVSGTVSGELINKAVVAVIIGSLLIMFWIGIRYNIGGLGFRYSAGGILALLHDLMILVGLFALLRNHLQVNSPFIAALLTVLGYSIHDTIIIYDRIRENMRLRKGRTFAETVNISLLETMARSVNTVLTVLFTLLALFFFGGPTLRDFVAALLIGVVVGAYSSIFIASQLLVSWAKGKEKIILPYGETLAPAAASTIAQPVTATAIGATAVAAPTTDVSRDAIQRAREAGKTSKRRK